MTTTFILIHVAVAAIVTAFMIANVRLLRARRPQNSMMLHIGTAAAATAFQYAAVFAVLWIVGPWLGNPGGIGPVAGQALFSLAFVLAFDYVKKRTGWLVLKLNP